MRLQRGSFRKDRPKLNRPITPTTMLGHEGARIYVQNGRFFGESGHEVKDTPAWARAMVDQMPEARREALGFAVSKPRGRPKKEEKLSEPEPKEISPIVFSEEL